jgi:transcriptional regulator with XRE-family HTH domain
VPDDPETVGQRLRESRRAIGLTQQQVADRLGVSRRAVSEWETDLRKPHVSIPALAALYGVSETFLLYGVEPASVELQQMRAAIDVNTEITVDLTQLLIDTRGDLVKFAEAVDATFAELRKILDVVQRELERSDEKPRDGH